MRERIQSERRTSMTDSELDTVYTRLCKCMTEVGEEHAALFLARFALLAIERIDDPQAAMQLIDAAGEGVGR
jgi:hypothetical protein